MMLNTSSNGQQKRALNIAKGIVGQEMLRRKLKRIGIKAVTQRKSYRDEDLFDFNVDIAGTLTRFDLKSVNYYTNYESYGRKPLSADLIIQYADYAGENWSTFFPMLVPHTQIAQSKEAYCFAIASSIDIRHDLSTDRLGYALTAFPYGKQLEFLSSKKLCWLRESAHQGIYLDLSYVKDTIFDSRVEISVLGEWAKQPCRIKVLLRSGTAQRVGPLSCVSSFTIDKESYEQLYGNVYIAVSTNEFEEPVLNTSRRNINVTPERPLVLAGHDFCNLSLPKHYTLYVLGWIYKEDFLHACRKYSGWVWPNDRVDRFKNQVWAQITERDRRMLVRTGFQDIIREVPRRVRGGWLKTTGHGNGACCYVFPNVHRFGGVSETNLYILPHDLYNMDSLNN